MDRLRQQLADVQRQLDSLTPSQKMLAASLVAIMVMVVLWSTRYAAVGEEARLLEQPLNAEQIGQIRGVLARTGVEYRVEGDAVWVPASKRDELTATLALERALPADLTRHFDKALGQIGNFDGDKKIDLTILSARQDALAAAIRRWPGVRHAEVHVNEQYKRQIGGDQMPSAGINLATLGGVDPAKLAESATHLVAGAFAMLDPANVEVIVDGRLIDTNADDSIVGGGSGLLDLQAKAEKHWENKLYNYLGYINGLRVAVSVNVQDDVRRTLKEEVDPDKTVVLPIETREDSDTQEAGGGDDSWGEAGLNPNTAMSLNGSSAGGGGGGESSDRRTLEERNRVEVSRIREERYSRGGLATPTSCTLSLPLSYVRAQWIGRNPGSGASSTTPPEPTPEQLKEFETRLREETAATARTLLANVDETDVMVVVYSDAGMGGGGLAMTSSASAGGLPGAAGDEASFDVAALVGEYGRPAAVVGLAAVALFFVSGIARRAPAPTSESLGTVDADGLAALTRRRAAGMVAADDDVADALGADAMLVGQEIADEQLEAGQMVEQVQSLVKENPDAAAQLIKRWVNQG